jgi:hypothetical protein
MVGMNPTTVERAREGVREFFLLERAEKKSETLGASQRQTIRTYHEAASRRISVAQDLRGPVQTPAALVLYQQGSFFHALAYLASKDESLDPLALTPAETFRRLDDAIVADGLVPPAGFDRAKSMLVASDPLELDRLTPEEAIRRIEELAVVARWLGHLVDARSPREIKTARAFRVLVAAGAALALLVNLGIGLFTPKNLAAHKVAVASSEALSTTASGAVDGSRSGAYGFHSQLEDAPWLSIDLGATFAITRLKVFGRADSPYDQSVPLALEVSDDGTHYRELAARTEPFSDHDPWVFHPAPALTTRYLRLRTMRRSYLVLSEVVVNGNPVVSK